MSQEHYYQPMFTLIGAGLRSLPQAHRPMRDVLPSSCDWIQDSAASFDPDNCQLTTKNGSVVRCSSVLLLCISVAKCYWLLIARMVANNHKLFCINKYRTVNFWLQFFFKKSEICIVQTYVDRHLDTVTMFAGCLLSWPTAVYNTNH